MSEKRFQFDRDKEWPFKRVSGIRYSPNRQKNTEMFIFWIAAKLQEAYGKPLKPGERLNCQAMYYSENNDLFIKDNIGPMAYLEFSPKIDKSLLDNEIVVELDGIIRTECATCFYDPAGDAMTISDEEYKALKEKEKCS